MVNKVRWLHGQLRVAKIPQQEYGQGAAGMLQEYLGWVKRPQEQPQARQEGAWLAREPQEMWVVVQPLEAKVSGVAKPPPWAAEPPQLWVGGSAQSPKVAPAQHVPPNLPAGHMLMAWQPPSPPPRWLHLFLSGLPPLPIPLTEASEPALHPSWPGPATLPVQRVPYPRPSS